MQLDDVTISRAITKNFNEDFQRAMDVEVAIGGAGPAGMTDSVIRSNSWGAMPMW